MGLWVPVDLAEHERRAVRDSNTAMLRFAVTTVGWEALTGHSATIDQVIDRLRRYSLLTIVGIVGRITLTLNDEVSHGEDNLARQHRIASGLIGPEQAGALINAVRTQRGPRFAPDGFALFHERQVLNALKIAFLSVDLEAPDPAQSDMGPLVEALLMLNDLIDPPEGSMGPGTEGGQEAMELYVSANIDFNQTQPLVREYVRSHYLYVEAHPEITDRSVVDVPAMLKHATGMKPEAVWNALYILYASWASRSHEDVEAGRIATSREDYLTTLPGLSLEERHRWFSLAVWEASELQQRIRDDYSLEAPRYWDVLPFEQRPLIAFGQLLFCSSIQLLRRLHGSSLIHRLQDHTVFDEQTTRRFRDTLGHLVERYTVELLQRAFGSRFLSERELQEYAGAKSVCDGIIVYPDAIVLVECKTASPLLGTRHAENYERYRAQWRRHMTKAADQIASTIDLIQSGAFAPLGIAGDSRAELYPVVCVFEQTVQPLAYRSVRNLDLAGHKLETMMSHGLVRPLQLLHVKEVEMLESAAEQGRSVVDLLRRKTTNAESIELPFHHYIYLAGETFQEKHSRWHAERWEAITKEAHQFFRELGLKSSDDEEESGQCE